MTRRIVQIQADADGLIALCDDGSLWAKDGAIWLRIRPDIPQDTPAESPDPIAELEALGGAFYRDPVRDGVRWGVCFNQTWLYEVIGERCDSARLRAAAARLLARVRGAK